MSDGAVFLRESRRRLAEESAKVLDHPFAQEAESGTLPREKLQQWCIQQHPILRYDTRSVGTMMARASDVAEKSFFTMLLSGADGAETKLELLAEELGLSLDDLAGGRLLPRAQAYGHYLAWLAEYGNPGEQIAAMTVNLPTYARVMARLQRSCEENYGLEQTDYLKLWSLGLEYGSDPADATAPPAWEEAAAEICGFYVEGDSESMHEAARFLQGYELQFWDAVYSGE